MKKPAPVTISVTFEQASVTLAALLRAHLTGHSWSQVRRHVATRRVQVNGVHYV